MSRWTDLAACTKTDLDPVALDRLFFGANQHQGAEFCNTWCPVRDECLAEALTFHWKEDLGVRGGKTQNQRRRIRFQQPAPTRQLVCQECGTVFERPVQTGRIPQFCSEEHGREFRNRARRVKRREVA